MEVIGKGWDLVFKTGYVNGYTQYATKNVAQLKAEIKKNVELAIQDQAGDAWYVGVIEGLEHALFLKEMNKNESGVKRQRFESLCGVYEVVDEKKMK